jgi:myosin heavy subunit
MRQHNAIPLCIYVIVFTYVQFSAGAASLAGGFIETYLLEKSRVLSQGEGERNFHVLYELVAGASSELKSRLALTRAEDYPVLSKVV